MKNRLWVNTRVVMDMTTGAILAREGFFYSGPLALAEGVAKTPEEQLKELQAALETATKDKDTTIAELAKVRKQLAEMQKGALSDDDRKLFDKLKADQQTLEDDRKRKEGQFDALKQQLIDSHTKEKKDLEDRVSGLQSTLRKTLVGREFAAASKLFGADGKTILTPAIAEAYYGRYVEVQDVDGSDEKVVVVKNANGQVIVDAKTGKPAAFADAMAQLIESMPDKDAVLRGSGKAGSGNSGGAGAGGERRDLANPKTAADLADPKVREAVKQKHNAAGGIQQGPVFDKR